MLSFILFFYSFHCCIKGSPGRTCSDRAAWCATLKPKKFFLFLSLLRLRSLLPADSFRARINSFPGGEPPLLGSRCVPSFWLAAAAVAVVAAAAAAAAALAVVATFS